MPGISCRAGAARRRLALVSVVVAVVPAGAAVAGPAHAPNTVLAATTVVQASGTGYVPVRVPKLMSFSEAAVPSITVSDPAAFAALVLVSDRRSAWAPGLVVAALPGSDTTYAYGWLGRDNGSPDGQHVFLDRRLHPGSYRLYLVASGPVSVTVRLPLPGGTARTAVARRTSYESISRMAAGDGTPVASSVFTISGTATVKRRALLFGLSWWDRVGAVAERVGGCSYSGPSAADDAGVEDLPTCPDGVVGATGYGVHIDGLGLGQSSQYVEPGRWLQKHFHQVGGVVTRGGGFVLWLELDG